MAQISSKFITGLSSEPPTFVTQGGGGSQHLSLQPPAWRTPGEVGGDPAGVRHGYWRRGCRIFHTRAEMAHPSGPEVWWGWGLERGTHCRGVATRGDGLWGLLAGARVGSEMITVRVKVRICLAGRYAEPEETVNVNLSPGAAAGV